MDSASTIHSGISLKNIGYSAIGGLGGKLLSVIGFFVLARLLSPYEFGLLAMVVIFIDFGTIFVELGIGVAIIHNQHADQRHYSSAFWANVFIGGICCLLLILSSPFIGAFFNSDKVISIAKSASILFFLHGLTFVPISLLQKRKHFREVALVEIISITFGIFAGISIALFGGGVWALVANLLTAAVIRVATCFLLSKWMPALFFGWNELATLWKQSSYFMGSRIFVYTITNVDKILLGKFIGSQGLGVYKNSYKLASYPLEILYTIFNRVFLSSYAELQQEMIRIKLSHLKALRLITFFSFPAMIGLSFLSDYFVLTFLGVKWVEMGFVLSYLAVILIPDTISVLNNPLYLALGRTKLQFRINVFCQTILLIGIFIGMYYGGLKGLLLGMLIAKIIIIYPVFYYPGQLVGIRIRDFLQNIVGIVISGIGMLVVLYTLQKSVNLVKGSLFSFTVLLCSGIFSYLILSLLFQKNTYRDMIALIKPIRQGA